MTQIVTPQIASIQAGPRGIGARAAGGAFTQDVINDILESDPLQGAPTLLSGSTDNLTPVLNAQTGAHQAGNYIIKTAGVDALTGVAPVAGVDDNLEIAIFSDTANAHTITFSTNCIADGVGGHHIITFAAQKGAGVILRAFNGTWQLLANTGCTIT